MQLYYVRVSLDDLANATLELIAAMLIDFTPYIVFRLKNVGRQLLPVICKSVSGSPFVKSNGLVMLQPGQSMIVESYRLDREQISNLEGRSLLIADLASIVINQ